MRIDLHTHSDRSDGTDGPRELLAHARDAGLDVVAITDHDTTVGWADAIEAARSTGVGLVPGIEVSCALEEHPVHLLAYLPDPAYEPLVAELDRILAGRQARLPATVERLRGLDIDISLADVERAAGPAAATGRPHVADVLVRKGVVGTRDEAFDRYLAAGRPAYVERYAADLLTMLGVVADAGGVSVVAHPWGRRGRSAMDADVFKRLRDHGLCGIEVDHEDHDASARADLHGIATDLDLIATGASDYHGAGKIGFDLGCNTTSPEQFERLLDTARIVAERAGRGAEAAL